MRKTQQHNNKNDTQIIQQKIKTNLKVHKDHNNNTTNS